MSPVCELNNVKSVLSSNSTCKFVTPVIGTLNISVPSPPKVLATTPPLKTSIVTPLVEP